MKRKGIDYYEWASNEEQKLIALLSNSTLGKTNYTFESKVNILHDNYISRGDLGVWLDDMENCCVTTEERLEYIFKALKENIID